MASYESRIGEDIPAARVLRTYNIDNKVPFWSAKFQAAGSMPAALDTFVSLVTAFERWCSEQYAKGKLYFNWAAADQLNFKIADYQAQVKAFEKLYGTSFAPEYKAKFETISALKGMIEEWITKFQSFDAAEGEAFLSRKQYEWSVDYANQYGIAIAPYTPKLPVTVTEDVLKEAPVSPDDVYARAKLKKDVSGLPTEDKTGTYIAIAAAAAAAYFAFK